ncbi:low molecular weight protein-tyrosine-phosphatase [Hoeflea ulvae]|uniref:protein-tyrosine-phosphatase n=1 Tax=Hoeflea ulvae TaxID=2983764 RepID=A0ABT3YAE0_9HYPH|nr:low molecular weight protein-tyrosine-phosphatase [Hoeflea ulvae]MCY0092730.1 low molecular weight phosphotyrosine protein phosphatase [Hoeflea ulvae]
MQPNVTDGGKKASISVLFVCMGNICRSPLAEGILRKGLTEAGLAEHVRIDSAGTGNWHQGDAPDPRSIVTAAAHGIDISAQRARTVVAEDFDRFDLILAMDRSNEAGLRARAPAARRDRIALFLEHTLSGRADIPDPYHGGASGFEDVYQLLLEGCSALVSRLGKELRHPSG